MAAAVRALTTAELILDYLRYAPSDDGPAMTTGELAAGTLLSRSTVWRHLHELERQKLVRHDWDWNTRPWRFLWWAVDVPI